MTQSHVKQFSPAQRKFRESVYGKRYEQPLSPDGIEQAATRLQEAFGDQAIEVAERWAKSTDVRYQAVANIIKARKASGPVT